MATFTVGDRVRTEAYGEGNVAYFGPHHEKPGDRVGILLDNPVGKNNGTVKGHKYFEAQPNHGALLLPKKVELVMPAAEWEAQNKKDKKKSKRDSKKEKKEAKEKEKSVKKKEKSVKKSKADAAAPAATSAQSPKPVAPVPEEPAAAAEGDGGDSSAPEMTYQDKREAAIKQKKMEELMKEEERKREEEEEKLRRKGSGAIAGRWAPPDEGVPQLSDKEIRERKEKRRASKHSVDKQTAKSPEVVKSVISRGRDDTVMEDYLDKMAAMKTLQRKVGGAKKRLEQSEAEADEEMDDLANRGGLTAGTYVDVAVWTFYNRSTTKRFIEFMTEIMDDDRQPEALFKIYELGETVLPPPSKVDPASGMRYRNAKYQDEKQDTDVLQPIAPDPSALHSNELDVSFLVVSVGSPQQFVELYQLYDVKKEIHVTGDGHDVANKKEDKWMAATRTGLKSLQACVYCNNAPRDMKRIIDDWDSEVYASYKLFEDKQTGVLGGWKAIAKFLSGASEDFLGNYSRLHFANSAARDAYRTSFKASAAKYTKAAKSKGLGPDKTAPLNFAIDDGATGLHTFGLLRESFWVKSTPHEQDAAGLQKPSAVYLMTSADKKSDVQKSATKMASWPGTAVRMLPSSIL